LIIIIPAQAIPVTAALVLGVIIANLAFLAVEATAAELEVHLAQDDVCVVREEREALRVVRVRYARGELALDEYQRLTFELEAAQPG